MQFFYPPQRVFFAVPCLLLPGQRDLLAGDGQLIEPLVGGVVDRIGHGGQRGVDDHLADALGTEGAGALVAALKYDMDMPDVVARRDLVLHQRVFLRHAAVIVGGILGKRHTDALQDAANHLRASRTYKKKNHPLPVLSVVDDGILRGYVPFDKDWTGFSAEEYREASESVMRGKQSNTVEVRKRLDLTGYEVVRAQYFATLQNPAMTISNGRLRFNAACLKKFEDVEYVELLLNSVDRCIAIRPCEKSNPNAIRWGRLKEGRWCASTLGCRGLAKALFDIMEWDEDLKYRFRGQLVEQGGDKLMLFELDEPEMIKVEEIVLPPKEEESEGETVKKTIYIYFGRHQKLRQ